MKPTLPKDGAKKIRKFVETAESLKSGKDTYFSITRLTSIKSLCNDSQTAAHFVFFLAERTLEKAESKPCPSHIVPDEWENLKHLMSEAVQAMQAHLEGPTDQTLSALRKLLPEIAAIQTYSGRQVWGRAIRTIHCWDVLIIEDALQCIIHPHAAGELAYRAARDYTEKYNPRHGTGLIPESVPMLEDIIEFWRSYRSAGPQESSPPPIDASENVRKARKRRGSARRARETQIIRMVKVTAMGSFEDKYPKIADWVQDGLIEIGYTEGSRSFIRVFDEEGMVWEGKSNYSNVDEAFEDAEKGILAWLGEND